MTDTPENWELSTVGDLMRFEGGSQPPKSTFISEPKEGYIRLIQIRDYKSNQHLTYVPIEKARKFCSKEDIMIGRYGPPIFQILRGLDGAYNVALIKAIPNKKILKEYAWHFLNSPPLFKYIDSLSQRSSGQTGIEMDELKNYPLPLPPMNEQEIISHIISVWNKSVNLLEGLIKEKKLLRNVLMRQLLSGELRFSEFKEKWEQVPLKKLIKQVQRPVEKPSTRYRALGIRSHFKGTFEKYIDDPASVAMDELYIANAGDLIVNITFAWEGAIAIVPEAHDGGLVSHRFPMYSPIKNKIDLDFLRYVVIQPRFKYLLGSISPGGAGRNRVLSKKDFLNLEISIPEIREQQKIGGALKLLDKQICLLEQQILEMKGQRNGMMQQLLTGKIRVKVTEAA